MNTAPQRLAAVQQDSGTITIVFSDIESSTERATAMGDQAWMKVLAEHNAIIRRHVKSWEGTVVKNQGDGYMLTFGGARRALQAMIAVQQELSTSAHRRRRSASGSASTPARSSPRTATSSASTS